MKAEKKPKKPATAETFFEAVNKFREKMMLTKLEWNKFFGKFIGAYIQDPSISLNPRANAKTFLSFNITNDSFNGQSCKRIIKHWMAKDPQRSALLAPGNCGYVGILTANEQEGPQIYLIVAELYDPKSK